MLSELQDITSPVSMFVRERCRVGPQYRVSVPDLFRGWQSWCESVGRKEPGTESNFGRELSAAVTSLRHIRPRENGERVRGYEGIGLKSAA
jgi:putative DNA primase/helicase